jgi:predicted nucleic acid-binding protein
LTAAYVDSSCLVAVLLEESPGAAARRALARYDQLCSSNLLEAEVASAARREGVTLRRASIFQDLFWVLPDRPLSVEMDRALAAGYLRGADLWHIAMALFLRDQLPEIEFLTLDGPQRQVASTLGFKTPLRVGKP